MKKLSHALIAGLLVVSPTLRMSSTMAATITVTTLEDEWNEDGDCSCREAIIAANFDAPVDACPPGSGDDVIEFAPGLAGGTINVTLAGGMKAIKNLTIRGNGITLDGGGTQELLLALADTGNPPIARFTIERLTLRNSRAHGLRAVAHIVEIRDCVFEDNGQVPVLNRGGISSSHDELILDHVVFRGNLVSVVTANGPVIPGATPVRTTILDCLFEDNPGGVLTQQTAGISVVEILRTEMFRNGTGVFVNSTTPRSGQTVTILDSIIAGSGPVGGRALHVGNGSLVMERTRVLTNMGGLNTGGVSVSATSTNFNVLIRESEIRGNVGSPAAETAGGLTVSGLPATIEDTTIADNRTSAPTSGNGAGGIRYNGPQLVIRRSTISGNSMSSGQRTGGIRVTADGVVVENSTISGNSPAGIDFLRVAQSEGRFVNNTIAFNQGAGVNFFGGNASNPLLLANNILATNLNRDLDGATAGYSGGFNLIGTTLSSTLPSDLVGASADLLPLANNGGRTETHALGPLSAALDAGDNALAAGLATDQRGLARIVGPRVDIGSVESAGPTTPPPTPPWIGDLVWEDLNGDGVKNGAEKGLHAVNVRLWEDKNGNGLIDDEPLPFRIRMTGGDGRYEFDMLPPGNYLVDVENDPAVLKNNPLLTTGKAVYAVNLGPGGSFPDADFGFQARGGAIEGLVWEDCLANGVMEASEEPLHLVPVTLHQDTNESGKLDAGDALIAVTLTNPDGAFKFPDLPTGRYFVQVDNSVLPPSMVRSTVGNPVTLDVEGGLVQDTGIPAGTRTARFGYFDGSIGGVIFFDTDGDGLMNPLTDEPLSGVEVRLHYDNNLNGSWEPTDPVIGVDVTDATGAYYFDELPPDGAYFVLVNQPTLPLKANTLVSGSLPIFRQLSDFQMNCRQVALPLLYRDSGTAGASISDFVWRDLDSDGVQDAGEPGVVDFRVRLLDEARTNLLATVFTDASGLYEFKGLKPGKYSVAFGPSLASLVFTARDRGGDDLLDSDPDPVTGFTDVIMLGVGERITSVDAGLSGTRGEPPTVRPVLPLPTLVAGGKRIRVGFMASVATLYRLQFSESLSSPAWRSIGPALRGNDAEAALEADLPAAVSAGFVRVAGWRE